MMMNKQDSEFDYIELLSAINIQRNNTRYYIYALLGLCILLVVTVGYVANKPPMVIRIDKLGNTEVVSNYKQESQITTAEDIKNFVVVFSKNYYSLRSDYVVPQLEKSINMMTENFKKAHMKTFKKHQTIHKIQAANVHLDLSIDSDITYETYGDKIDVKFEGKLTRRTLNNDQKGGSTRPFTANLTLVKTNRLPLHPYGLLIDTSQLRFNNTEEVLDEKMEGILHD
jgi:hypothetical protein